MWVSWKNPCNGHVLWVLYFVLISLQTSIASSSLGKPPIESAVPTTMDDGVQRIGVGEVLIVDEFGREARSYWDSAAAEEKVETVTVYGGMEVVSGGSSNDGGPDVVKGHVLKNEQNDSREDSSESDPPGQNSIKDSGLETTLLDCVLHGDIPCIQKKAFRAIQKLIQMSNSGAFPGSLSSAIQDNFSTKESDDSTEKVNKGVGILSGQGWWAAGSGGLGVAPKPVGTVANPGMVDDVISAVSTNGGMSRLLEEVRDLVVDLVSNVISLQEDEDDRMRKMEKRSGDDEKKRRRKRRGVVAKKEAGPAPMNFGSRMPSIMREGEKASTTEQEKLTGKGAESTSVQRGGGGGGDKKKRRNGMNSILMGIMTLKSIFSYIGMVFSHIIQLKQFGLSLLSFLVSVLRLIILLRQQNNEKQPVTDTKVVYLRPQYSPSHYGEHIQPQHYGAEHYKRSFDGDSDPAPQDGSAHDLAYGAQKPSNVS